MFGALVLPATALAGAQDKAGNLAANYPLQVGNQWTQGHDRGQIQYSRLPDCQARIENDRDKLPLARLEASVNGNVRATEHLMQTEQGIFRYRNNDKEITPPICLLKYLVSDKASLGRRDQARQRKGQIPL